MTIEQYFVVENNVVTNSVMWDGNTQEWTPPTDATMLVSSTTPAMIWEAIIDPTTKKITGYQLVESIGSGGIGFTWNGSVLTTNQPKPAI